MHECMWSLELHARHCLFCSPPYFLRQSFPDPGAHQCGNTNWPASPGILLFYLPSARTTGACLLPPPVFDVDLNSSPPSGSANTLAAEPSSQFLSLFSLHIMLLVTSLLNINFLFTSLTYIYLTAHFSSHLWPSFLAQHTAIESWMLWQKCHVLSRCRQNDLFHVVSLFSLPPLVCSYSP